MWLSQVSLYSVAVVFAGFGVLFMASPQSLTAMVEIAMPSPVATMEIRGVYGGFFLGTGLLFMVFARREAWHIPGLVAQAAIMGGLVLGRTLGIVLDGAPNALIASLLGGEVFGFVVALVLLWLSGREVGGEPQFE